MNLIGPNNFSEEVLNAKGPVLLLYIIKNGEYSNQYNILEQISIHFGPWLKTGILDETTNEFFKKILKIPGSPTYLFFFQGKEKKRILGVQDITSLMSFVSEALKSEDNEL
ncbi:MAG: hypothetical protein N2572_09335 [Syntrophales bacterium]|nr:hypothetical protein [Syntrophales bacterium]